LPRVPAGKVGIYIYVTKGTLEKFHNLVHASARSSYGDLSRPIEVAMEEYIASHSTLNPHTHMHMNPGFPLDKTICLQILQALGRRGIEKEFLESHLADAVAEVRGSDKRTVKHWTERLLHYEFISVKYPGLTEEDAEGKTLMNPKWARHLQKTPIFKVLYHPR